ncbi:hypothetical protein A2814_01355 [Candidatus Nomurabacteria bacterium RIFCSPHIGHO2_01_FULL_38_19]|uniref:Uncharacterized protein n=1 Tax=Candidatus Nomurabacteria bacterium RIFCSPHIGHO2_01_FULL_38_19 TaxID=1801732 RepID=A0A1F6UQR0_9BACT|nr:MAG: hypothetical protein A2814_01355 [Candidatus Nomurabacteria bacterium RIFCSPHIGHO2_01_FULL_38_19]
MEYLSLYIAGGVIGLILLVILIMAGGLLVIFPILGVVTIIIFGFEHWILTLLTFVAVIYAISTMNLRAGEAKGYKMFELARVSIISSIIIVGLFITALVIN